MNWKQLITSIFILAVISVCIPYYPAFADQHEQPVKGEPGTPGSGPFAVAVNPIFEFPMVIEGKVVTHAFRIENRGKETLEILNVKTGCGCTTADYSKEIAPGKTGEIVINGDTKGYGGQMFSKKILVHTNDPQNEKIFFEISGPVEKTITVAPERVRLTGKIGDDISETVKIVPEKKYAFKITGITLSKNENIKYELKESENSGGTEYHLTVSNISKERGRYFDTITIDTDSSVNPKIEIKVFGNIAGNIKE